MVARMSRPLLLCLLVAAACAPFRKSTAVCPEYRELRCLTAPECSMDRERGCQVCRCSQAGTGPGTAEPLPSGVAPDRR